MPIYLQLMEQVKHAIETGVLRPGEQLPGIRKVAEDLVMNPNTVAKAFRELEHEGVIELRHGLGAFVSTSWLQQRDGQQVTAGQDVLREALAQLAALGFNEEQIRRLFESELNSRRTHREAGQ